MSGRRIRFGSHELDLDAAVLRRGRARCALQSQPLRLLALLVERRGDLVTREEIRAQLRSDTVVEYDQSINFAVRQIRIALGPDADFVQTVPRRGYRFVGPVSRRTVTPEMLRKACAVAAAVVLALVSGFAAGIVISDAPVGRFVYVHLVHPDRCPYIRPFLPTHRNS